jgi:hypothetical protein
VNLYFLFHVKKIDLNLPQFNGHFKKYTEAYTMEKKGVPDEREAKPSLRHDPPCTGDFLMGVLDFSE